MRILVGIASYGNSNDAYLAKLIASYRQMRFDVDVVVLTEASKDVDGATEIRIGLPTSHPYSLPFAHKELFAERADAYDLFIYSEDDTLITQKHVDSFLWATSVLPPTSIAGFLRSEKTPDGTLSCSTVHNHFHWIPESACVHGGQIWAEFSNPHSGSFILTRAQLRKAIESGGFIANPHAARYDMLVTAATDPYTSCGFNKLICVSRLDDFLLPHLSNKYHGSMGLALDEVKRQGAVLERIALGLETDTRLFNPRARTDDHRWDKRFYEAPDSGLLARVPRRPCRILSVAVGSGALETALLERGHEVVGIPLDNVIAATAAHAGIRLTSPDLEQAQRELAGERFDVIVAQEALHHFRNPALVVGQLVGLAAPGGLVLATVPNRTRHYTKALVGRGRPLPEASYGDLEVHIPTRRTAAGWLRDGGAGAITVSPRSATGAVLSHRVVLAGRVRAVRAPRRVEGSAGPPVSIGLPVYNGEKYLAECLRSIQAQDYVDFEVIISDNASSDRTEEICREFQQSDARFRYQRRTSNGGAAINYNSTFLASRGTYFTWWAHDDTRAPCFISRCLEAFESGPESRVLVHPRAQFIDPSGCPLQQDTDVVAISSSSPGRRFGRILSSVNMANAVFGLIRSRALERTRLIGPFIASDYVLLAELALLGELHETPEVLMFRRLHEGSSRAANATDHDVARWFRADAGAPRLSARQRLCLEYSRAVLRAPLSKGDRAVALAAVPALMLGRQARNRAGRWRRELAAVLQ
ncbi:MAG: glycosyltransferase [Acidimicrobiia bacterium]